MWPCRCYVTKIVHTHTHAYTHIYVRFLHVGGLLRRQLGLVREHTNEAPGLASK